MLRTRRRVRHLDILRPFVAKRIRRRRKVWFGDPAEGERELVRFASYNIHKCIGADGRFDPERIIAVVKEVDADVIALQEVDQRFGEREGLLDMMMLERECGLAPVPLVPTKRSHGWRGNLILFRKGTVTTAQQLALPGVEPRGALVVDLELGGGALRIIAAHFGLLRHSRARQAKAILDAAATDDDRPVILMGDLNEWRVGERSSLRALEPSFGPLQAAVASFPSRFPVLPLDRILASPQSLVRGIEVHDTPLARIASDHLPIKAAICLPAGLLRGRGAIAMASAA